MTIELSILTLNIWGIPYISSDREVRINAIGDEILKGHYDIISLQEVWTESDYQKIVNKISQIYTFTHYFYSGVFGSGLCIFSKYPIVSVFFHAWSVNGYAHRIQHADWFGGKGVGLCRIMYENKPINIYIAHLHAEYDIENDEYKAHRVIQAFDTAQFIESTKNDAILQVIAGDLNAEPSDLAFKILTKYAGLHDCYSENEKIGTHNSKSNSYTSLKVAEENPVGERIDHILIKPANNYQILSCDYRIPFADRIPGKSFSYSDHEAVSVKLKIIEKSSQIKENDCIADDKYCSQKDPVLEKTETIMALEESILVCEKNLNKVKSDRLIYFGLAAVLLIGLFSFMEFTPSYGYKTISIIVKFLISAFIIFFLFMATIWNAIERHGILSGKLSMEIALRNCQK